jgi:hypothetical protein
MSHPTIWAAANERVIDLDGDGSAPIVTEDESRPEGEGEAQNDERNRRATCPFARGEYGALPPVAERDFAKNQIRPDPRKDSVGED